MKKIIFAIAIIFAAISFSSCTKDNDFESHHYGNHFERSGLSVTSSVSSPNSVGGVVVSLTIENNTGKTIKYLGFAGDMKNVFGDNVYCEIRDQIGMQISITGPIYDGDCVTYYSNDCFYNNTAKTYCINAVSVQFLGEDWIHWH